MSVRDICFALPPSPYPSVRKVSDLFYFENLLDLNTENLEELVAYVSNCRKGVRVIQCGTPLVGFFSANKMGYARCASD